MSATEYKLRVGYGSQIGEGAIWATMANDWTRDPAPYARRISEASDIPSSLGMMVVNATVNRLYPVPEAITMDTLQEILHCFAGLIANRGIRGVEQLVGAIDGNLVRVWTIADTMARHERMKVYGIELVLYDKYPDVEIYPELLERHGRSLETLATFPSGSISVDPLAHYART